MQKALVAIMLLAAPAAFSAERDAIAVSQNVQALHMPYGTVIDPVFVSQESTVIAGYSRCGDSAIWTGHYLAAESFRYAVTKSKDAFNNAVRAVNGLRTLVDVTGTDVLARCLVPKDSPYAAWINSEEAPNGVHSGSISRKPYYWIGRTSRDQYSGALFGLSVAYAHIEDAGVRNSIRTLATRMLEFLERHDWRIVMPDGKVSTIFFGRFDQQLAFLAIGRQVNPQRFTPDYESARLRYGQMASFPIAIDALDTHSSYFKFNLDAVNLYSLVQLDAGPYNEAYGIWRDAVKTHGNAAFNMIDRALNGANASRDAETRALLNNWLVRSRRDLSVDLRGVVAGCGSNQACAPIPVRRRVNTDYLWQRSPFQMVGGGSGLIETAGIDYILPYWMARYYKVLTT